MKKSLLFLFVLMLSAVALFAQAPQKMSYQAVVRNANNTLVTSQNVSARVSILQGSVNGTPVYVEIHNATTNANGLLTLEVGGGSTVTGSLATVDWANGPFFLKSEIDPNGGVNYSIEGTQQLMSVPYALYAEKAGNVPAFGITPVDSGYVIAVTQPGGTPQTYFLPTGGGQGPAGNDGQDGVGIDSIAKTGTADNVDTYTIYYSNNTTSTYTVTNGVDGAPGTPGDPGTPGAPGDPGFSPTITVDTGAAGMVLTITDVNGTNQYIIPNGGGSGSGGTIVQQQVNWNETNPASVSYILNKPSLATVATSGSYNDLLDKPAIPTNISQLNNDAGFVTTASVPTLNVTQTDTGYVLTITENGSTQTYILRDGRDGQDGQDGNDGNDGEDGNDGVSPTITLDTAGSNLMVTITDANGSNTTIIPLSSGSGTFTQLPADWNATSGVQQILHKPTLATVATSGNYNDLTNKPTIPAEQVQANWNETNTSSKAYIQNKPTIPAAQVNADWNATSGTAQILNKPELATVATSGSYNDLSNKPTIPAEQVQANWNETNTSSKAYIQNKPTIPAAQVNADWNATSGVAQIMNKPVLADVATSGDYDDLDNKPTLATVATSGSYNDLTNKPTIPDAQVNADWNATSGMAEILNKPDIAGMQNTMDSLADALDNLHESMGFICGKDKVKDIDGNEYNTVKIGQQCWMKENLRTTKYPNGTEIPIGTDSSSTIGTRNAPGSEANVATRGYLYNWVATMNGATSSGTNPSGVQGICPDGWHVPSLSEFKQLVQYMKSQEEYTCGNSINNIGKALASTLYWTSSTTSCAIGHNLSENNASGFSAVPTGLWASNFNTHQGEWYYGNQNSSTYFWSSEEHPNLTSVYVLAFSSSTNTYPYLYNNPKTTYAYAVRCLHDSETSALQDIIDQSIAPLQNAINTLADANFTCGQSKVIDYDGNEYATVSIGNQCWMKENLKTRHYSDGTEIPAGTDSSLSIGYYYESDGYLNNNYGFYYNWPAVMRNAASSNTNPSNVQGVCPVGWHVPSSAEFTELINAVKSNSDYVCGTNDNNIAKALADSLYWSNSTTVCAVGNDPSSNNATGFSVKCGGMWVTNFSGHMGQFYYGQNGMSARLWTSEETTSNSPIHFYLSSGSASYYLYSSNGKESGFQVRCIKDPKLSINSIQDAIDNFAQDLNSNTFVCGASKVKDYDGNEYKTVKIGNQCWTKENLKSTHFTNGTAIALGNDTSSTVAYRYNPGNDANNVSKYGYLYNWAALVNGETGNHIQGICPVGWHVPLNSDLTELINYVKSQSEYVCGDTNINIAKSLAGTTGWNSSTIPCSPGYDPSSNNATGFSLLPTGYINTNSSLISAIGSSTFLWCLSSNGSPYRWPYTLYYTNTVFSGGGGSSDVVYKRMAGQVRCLRDATDESPLSSMMIDVITPLENRIDELENRIDELQNTLISQLAIINQLMNSTFSCGDKIMDVDGNLYSTVQIGSQCWMKENLRTTKYPDGTQIPLLTDSSSTIGARYNPNGVGTNVQNYGYLYNWTAVMNGSSFNSGATTVQVQGICPIGWHVPSKEEFLQLRDYVKSVPAYVCESDANSIAKALADSINWLTYSSATACAVTNQQEINNATGFTASPAGHWSLDNSGYVGIMHWNWYRAAAEFRTSTQYNSSSAYRCYLYYTGTDLNSSTAANKVSAVSVRCLKD